MWLDILNEESEKNESDQHQPIQIRIMIKDKIMIIQNKFLKKINKTNETKISKKKTLKL